MQDEKLIEAICAARFSELPGHWTDGLTPGIIEIERMKAERILPIIAREVAEAEERCARVEHGLHRAKSMSILKGKQIVIEFDDGADAGRVFAGLSAIVAMDAG